MKTTIALSFLVLSSFSAQAKTYQYGGLEGKLSNLTDIPNSQLEVVAEICRWDGFFRKCSSEIIKSKLKDGSFLLKPKTIKYDDSKDIVVKHYLIDRKTDTKFDLLKKNRNASMKFSKKNFTLLDFPKIEAEVSLEDGRSFAEWKKSSDRPNQPVMYQISAFDLALGKYVSVISQEIGKGVTLPEKRQILPVYLEAGKGEFELKAYTFGNSEGKFASLLEEKVKLNSLEELERAIEASPLSKKNLIYDISGIYSTVFMQKGHSFLAANAFRGPEAMKVISKASFKCSGYQASAKVNFQVGAVSLEGSCDDNGKAEFPMNHTITGQDGLALVIKGKLRILSSMSGEMYGEIILENGEIFGRYNFHQEYYPRVFPSI